MPRLISLFRSSHPMPSLSVAGFAFLFGLGIGLSVGKSALAGLAVLLQQLSVGLSNDWLDLKRDKAVGRKDKPVAKGEISSSLVRNSSFISGLAALLIALLLGAPEGAWMIFMLAVGWSYNLGLKSNWLSVAPYAVGFGILPVFVTLAMTEPIFPPAWIVLVASLLGVSAHFANALPDLLDDKATGVRALPHILGQRLSAIIIAVTALAASLIVVTQASNLESTTGLIGLILTVALAGTASILSLRHEPPRIVFPLLILASLVNVILLMLGTGSL
jgi:4-hydroxybenzoate polyprenyltransferase